jgi:hypothetical protein
LTKHKNQLLQERRIKNKQKEALYLNTIIQIGS